MFVPNVVLDHQAVSGITGSISIACWIIVFTPQLYENFKRQSADGLSLSFVVLWLIGDIFNVVGAILQNLLPTMIILAIYYTLADIVLLLQCIVYNKRQQHHVPVDPTHLSPATPLLLVTHEEEEERLREGYLMEPEEPEEPVPTWKAVTYNSSLVILVVLAGILGWLVSNSPSPAGGVPIGGDEDLEINMLGQALGWLCAAFYLGSRVPQILLNFERKSVEGISFLFFLFACLGNLTYVISILAAGNSLRYLLINASWLVGSVGTLFLDMVIFVQFWMYNDPYDTVSSESSSETSIE